MMEIPERVGSIRLEEILGEGAMGTVWAGVDEKLRRDVAVKTLRGDSVTVETRARLLTEARILSQVEAPGICRIYDYVEGDESDYLVLERIRGRTLRELTREKTDRSTVLRIGEELAEALAAAHARGVIHRDLKPSNIMLTREGDDEPEHVKVLDFGIARTAGEKAETSKIVAGDVRRAMVDGTLTRFGSLLATEEGAITGTPAYMSPEQARGEAASAASDMYSLGLTLQELATGRPAYPKDLPLSQLVSKAAVGATLPVEGVDGELKSLIEDLKAPAPERRPTAREAVLRLQRIRDRPRRLRRVLTVGMLLLAGALGLAKYTTDLQQERNRAVAAGKDAQEVGDFLTSLFTAAPEESKVDVRVFLDEGVERIDELGDSSLAKAHVLQTFGTLYSSLGEHKKARVLLEEAVDIRRRLLGGKHPELADVLMDLAMAESSDLDLEANQDTLREALDIRREVLGNHPDTLIPLLRLAHLISLKDLIAGQILWSEIRDLQRKIPELAPDAEQALWSAMAASHSRSMNWDEVEGFFRRSAAICNRDPDCDRVTAGYRLSGHLAVLGRWEDAEEALLPALDEARELYGEPSWPFGMCLMGLAEVRIAQGDLTAATEAHRGAFAVAEAHFASGTVIYGYLHEQAARLLGEQGNFAEAVVEARRAAEVMGATLGGYYEARATLYWAELLRRRGDLDEAASQVERGLEILREIHGESSWLFVLARSIRGGVLSAQGRREEAEPLLIESFRDIRRTAGDRSLLTRDALDRLVEHYEANGEVDLVEQTRSLLH